MTFNSPDGRIGVVIEIKQCDDIRDIESVALDALRQIGTQKYYQDFLQKQMP